VQDRALSYDEAIRAATALTAQQGFDTVKIDAKIGR